MSTSKVNFPTGVVNQTALSGRARRRQRNRARRKARRVNQRQVVPRQMGRQRLQRRSVANAILGGSANYPIGGQVKMENAAQCNIANHELFASVYATTGQVSAWSAPLEINSGNILPWLSRIGRCWEFWLPIRMRVTYVPVVSVVSTGQIGMYFDYDSDDTRLMTIDALFGNNKAMVCSIRDQSSFEIDCSHFQFKRYKCSEALVIPGKFHSLVESDHTGIVGRLLVEYVVRFTEQQVSSDVNGAVSIWYDNSFAVPLAPLADWVTVAWNWAHNPDGCHEWTSSYVHMDENDHKMKFSVDGDVLMIVQVPRCSGEIVTAMNGLRCETTCIKHRLFGNLYTAPTSNQVNGYGVAYIVKAVSGSTVDFRSYSSYADFHVTCLQLLVVGITGPSVPLDTSLWLNPAWIDWSWWDGKFMTDKQRVARVIKFSEGNVVPSPVEVDANDDIGMEDEKTLPVLSVKTKKK